MKKKSFKPSVDVMKLFSSSLTFGENKLECSVSGKGFTAQSNTWPRSLPDDSLGRAPALLSDVRLGCKGLSGILTNFCDKDSEISK